MVTSTIAESLLEPSTDELNRSPAVMGLDKGDHFRKRKISFIPIATKEQPPLLYGSFDCLLFCLQLRPHDNSGGLSKPASKAASTRATKRASIFNNCS
jgi:hypothetical protein